MLENFLELPVFIYLSAETDKYHKRLSASSELEEDLGIELDKEPVEPPKAFVCTTSLRPQKIDYFMECFSPQETYIRPNNPRPDMVSVTMKNGELFNIPMSLSQFKRKLKAFYKRNPANV